ncbi:MAG: hypothetical protein QGH34_02190 [Candidatus Woesearchaeota archaeon]|nr:hypothetical protein [Candidatus Woesearchaeota archaeon]
MKRSYDVKKEAVIMFKKSQAALEFLTTYVWAFLGIMIALGALYYFGIFEFSKFLPQKCIFSSQFECTAFSFEGNQIKFRLVNNIGEEIKVKTISISPPLDCSSTQSTPLDWESEGEIDFTFTLGDCPEEVFIEGERTEAQITMTYCAPATTGCLESEDVDHRINGKITAIVT